MCHKSRRRRHRGRSRLRLRQCHIYRLLFSLCRRGRLSRRYLRRRSRSTFFVPLLERRPAFLWLRFFVGDARLYFSAIRTLCWSPVAFRLTHQSFNLFVAQIWSPHSGRCSLFVLFKESYSSKNLDFVFFQHLESEWLSPQLDLVHERSAFHRLACGQTFISRTIRKDQICVAKTSRPNLRYFCILFLRVSWTS